MTKNMTKNMTENNKENIDTFISVATTELSAIKDTFLPKEDNYSFPCPDTTKEEWFVSNETHKNGFIKRYNNEKEYYDKNSTWSLSIEPFTTDVFIDEDVLNAAKGFFTGPVGIFRGQMVCAESKSFSTLEELKEYTLNECKERDMVLYMTFATERKGFGDLDFFNLSVEEQQKIPTVPLYVWRGTFVDKIKITSNKIMSNKNYKIKLTITDPDTDKSINASMDMNMIQDMKAMNATSALDEMLSTLTSEFDHALDNETKINALKDDLDKTLKFKKAFEELDTEYPDKESTEYKLKRAEILKLL